MAARQDDGARGRGGSPAYSETELLNLLSVIERIIPVSGEEWDQVEVHHNILYPVRKAEGLRRKFQELYRKKKSTGDPDCPLSVKRAKLLRRAIIERCEVDNAEVDEVVQGVGHLEILPEFPGIQRLHEIAEDSGEEGVVDPPQAPAPQPAAEEQPPLAEVNQPAVALPPAVPSVRQPVAQAEANAAAAMGVDPTRVTLSQLGGKRKKADEDPLLELYKLKMLESAAEREEERKRLRLDREDREADRLEERMLRKNEMEIRRVEAESFKMMMMALLASNKKDG
jgi:hypothetical protein